MKIRKGFLSTAGAVILMVLCFSGLGWTAQYGNDPSSNPVADVSFSSRGVYFQPKVMNAGFILSVSYPDGYVVSRTFESGSSPYFEPADNFIDGVYTYELRVIPFDVQEKRISRADPSMLTQQGLEVLPQKVKSQSGHFRVQGGSIITSLATEGQPIASIQDVLHYDDVIITGSTCIGFDCADGESFGFDTLKLKEHNLRILFEDGSYTASYPTNDWRITINDSTNGGASYFSIDDVDDGTQIFKVEAGAPSNSLYVEDYGRVGLGTSTPVVELHIKDSDTPTTRLEQDSSGGWTAQTWDVAGNESNFFVRDATNGSQLPFRIQPSTPSSTLCLKADGRVGIGTWSPGYAMELEKTGENAAFILDRTDGAMNYINATSSFGNFGTVNDFPLRLVVNGLWKMRLDSDGSLQMNSGATCSAAGEWNNASSREYKENIQELTSEEAMDVLDDLSPVKFNYKVDKEQLHAGFIAEDVPELVAAKDRKTMGSMDVVAVLTKVLQEQQKTISHLETRITELEKELKTEK